MNRRELRLLSQSLRTGKLPRVAPRPPVQPPVPSDGIWALRDHRTWPLGYPSAERMVTGRDLPGGDR
jgi:hypothetical protein